MPKSMPPLLAVLALAFPAFAQETELDREWRLIRQQLERIGIKVNHHAKTEAERLREAREIRRQLESLIEPRPGIHNGGASPNRKPIRQAPAMNGLGAKRKL